MSAVRMHVNEPVATIFAQCAIRTHRTMSVVVEHAINTILDAEEAASRALAEAIPTLDLGHLLIIVEHPIIVAFYKGKVAAVGVDIAETGRVTERITIQGYTDMRVGKGRPPLIDWAPWFRELAKRSGLELAS